MAQVGDKVTIQGMPGKIVDENTDGPQPLYLVVIQTPSIRWVTAQQLGVTTPATPVTPATTPTK